jgi:hypothetical protein
MFAGMKGIAAETAPQSHAANLGDQSLRNHVLTISLTNNGKSIQLRMYPCENMLHRENQDGEKEGGF